MNRYELQEELGDGSFGRVMKAVVKGSGEAVAIKHIKRKFKTWKAAVDLREVQSLRDMAHPNVCSIKEVIRERDENLYFVFEYMPDGSLFDLTKACIEERKAGKPERLTIDVIRSFVRQILCGLSYIHNQGYVHRDIKPENILVKGNALKVADFGLARQAQVTRGQITYYVSTRWYRAPEVILHCPSYGKPIDLFATGLILAELFSLRPLFPGTSEIDQLTKMMDLLGPPTEESWEEGVGKMKRMYFRLAGVSPNGASRGDKDEIAKIESSIQRTLPKETSPAVAKLIRLMIGWNPASRPTADGASQHEFFQSDTAANVTRGAVDAVSISKTGAAEQESRQAESTQRYYSATAGQSQPGKDTESQFASKILGRRGKVHPTTIVERTERSQPRNEFSLYLDAFASAGTSKPSEKKTQDVFPGEQSDDIAPRHYFRPLSDLSTMSTRRNRMARSTSSSMNDVKPAKKTARKRRKSHSRFSHSGRTTEKPRWIHGSRRRCVQVSIGKPEPLVNESEVAIPPHAMPKSSSDDPFTCLAEMPEQIAPRDSSDDPFTCLADM